MGVFHLFNVHLVGLKTEIEKKEKKNKISGNINAVFPRLPTHNYTPMN